VVYLQIIRSSIMVNADIITWPSEPLVLERCLDRG